MAEVEYQVDELFFRINTLTGSHGLPEKATSYFTDSDGTYGLGDDGISSGGSEVRKMFQPVILRIFVRGIPTSKNLSQRLTSDLASKDLQLLMQSVPITTSIVSSNPTHGEVYSIQHFQQVDGILQIFQFLPTF
jgi:hypothetical protein